MRQSLQTSLATLLLIVIVLASALPMLAQDGATANGDVPAIAGIITDDDVNAVAKKLYCPVCENIPLDACGTLACQDWRYEIRLQLEAGMTEQEIIDDFIMRFGERVVGTPQDPVLRALSLVTPWLIVIAAAVGVFYSLLRLRQTDADESIAEPSHVQDNYRQLLEQDLSG